MQARFFRLLNYRPFLIAVVPAAVREHWAAHTCTILLGPREVIQGFPSRTPGSELTLKARNIRGRIQAGFQCSMPSNVELKARLADPTRLIPVVRTMAHAHAVLRQEDTYFGAVQGRLKLRLQEMLTESGEAQDETATLYFYDRPDTVGPKRSDYDFIRFSTIDEASVLKVVLEETQTTADGQAIAERLCKELSIGEDDLISGSYIDMLPHQPLWQ
ncbi:uncharacterized protein LOC119170775 isoform X3 [Rhipicephalus microplus]|uniref:uncharacterized protein LOC119170775 isoform X3 n=1 Tax=Rhipicephalus microplus TaxID=6941 RepID=UPI003F6BF254